MNFIHDILDQSSWLYTKLYQNELFFFDLWSIVHLWSGFSIYLLLRALQLKRPMIVLALILILYEIAEILFIYFAFMIFRPETIKDQFTDIFVGMAGAALSWLYLKAAARYREKAVSPAEIFLILVVSFTYAFVWVGFYHYRYNNEAYNTQGIAWPTAMGWTFGGVVILGLFRLLPVKKLLPRLALTWLLFFTGLLAFEYLYFYILDVREISGLPLKPLIFGLIHGTRKLHVFYVIAPFIIIGLFNFGKWLTNNAINDQNKFPKAI
jgi:hypothetical protein